MSTQQSVPTIVVGSDSASQQHSKSRKPLVIPKDIRDAIPKNLTSEEEIKWLENEISKRFVLCIKNPENKKKTSASVLAGRSPFSQDPLTSNNLYFDNRVRSCAWPPADNPSSFPKHKDFADIMPLLTAYGFRFEPLPDHGRCTVSYDKIVADPDDPGKTRIVTRKNKVHYGELARETVDLWAQVSSEIAWEKKARDDLGLTPLHCPKGSRKEIVQSLNIISSICHDATPVPGQNEAEARRPWDTIAQCARRIPVQAGEYGIDYRLEREVFFPRNQLFDRIAAVSKNKDKIQEIAEEHASIALSEDTLLWTPDQKRLQSIPGSESVLSWLEDVRKSLPDVMAEEQDRLKTHVERWWEQLKAEGYIDLKTRALRTFHYGVCDLVIFVTIPNVFSDTDVNKNASQIRHLRLIGSHRPKQRGQKSSPSDEVQNSSDRKDESDQREPDRDLEGPPVEKEIESTSSGADEARKPVRGTLQQQIRLGMERRRPRTIPSANNSVRPSDTSDKDRAAVRAFNSFDLRHVLIPMIWHEDKRPNEPFSQACNQTNNYVMSTVGFLHCIGIHNVKVFGLATVGHKGLLVCAWGEKESGGDGVDIYIADVNCPEFDISREADAVRFRSFLTQLRTVQAQKIFDAFNAVRDDFLAKWREDPGDRRFRWTSESQQTRAANLEKDVYALRSEVDKQRTKYNRWKETLESMKKELEEQSRSAEQEAKQ